MHPSVGTQNQPNPWNCFLFCPFGTFRGPSKPSSQSGFDLMTCDSYFTISVFTNHISAENTCLTNYIVDRTPDCGLKSYKYLPSVVTLETFLSTISSIIRFLYWVKYFQTSFSWSGKKNCKDGAINDSNNYLPFDLLEHLKSIL